MDKRRMQANLPPRDLVAVKYVTTLLECKLQRKQGRGIP